MTDYLIKEERLKQIHEQVPPDYYDKSIRYNLFQRYWHLSKFKTVLEFIEPIIKTKNSAKVLEIGCAGGTLIRFLKKYLPACKFWGLDLSQPMIDYAKNHTPDVFFDVGDVNSASYPEDFFDVILVIETFEHLLNPEKSLRKIKKFLKNTGSIILLTQLEKKFTFRIIWWLWKKGKGRVWQDAHSQKFNLADLERIFKKSGFRIVKSGRLHARMSVIYELKKDN